MLYKLINNVQKYQNLVNRRQAACHSTNILLPNVCRNSVPSLKTQNRNSSLGPVGGSPLIKVTNLSASYFNRNFGYKCSGTTKKHVPVKCRSHFWRGSSWGLQGQAEECLVPRNSRLLEEAWKDRLGGEMVDMCPTLDRT